VKIMLVSPYDFTYPGGANNHIINLAQEYRALGHDTRVVAPATTGRPLPALAGFIPLGTPVPIHSNGSTARITLSPTLSRQVKRLLADERPDVIHLHEPLMPTLPLTVLWRAEVRTVGTFHAFAESNLGYFYARPLLQRFFERLDARIAVSRPAADFVGRYFGGDYTIIPNGIETGQFGPGVQPLPQYRDGRPTILFVGRYNEPRKGFRYLLRAFALVRDQFPDARLLVVGGGDPDLYADDLTRLGAQGVEFAGYVETEQLPRYYVSCDLFCTPSIKGESFGIILLEAIASGRAVVASRIPGHASVIDHGQDGWLVPPQDPVALALALVRLLADREKREEIAAAGLRKARRYAWSEVARRVLDVYQGQGEAAVAPQPALSLPAGIP
jgi:phosphatidyl-myo-inositol alpha-mannosyltransferase